MTRTPFPKPVFLPAVSDPLLHLISHMLVSFYHSWAFNSHLKEGHKSYPVPIFPYVLFFPHEIYRLPIRARAGYFTSLFPYNPTSCFGFCFCLSKGNSNPFPNLSMSMKRQSWVQVQSTRDAGSRGGSTGPVWPWPRLLALVCLHATGRTERQQEGKELIWKSSWLLHLHLTVDRMRLDGENDCVYSACLHRDSLFLGNIQSVMPPKSTRHQEKHPAGLTLSCSCTGWTPVFVEVVLASCLPQGSCREDLFLLRLRSFCNCWAMFSSHLLR